MPRETKPQVALLDIAMLVLDGLTALLQIRAACPDAASSPRADPFGRYGVLGSSSPSEQEHP